MNTQSTPILSAHLSEEDLDDLLLGEGSPATRAHLAACPECKAQLASFQSTLAFFNQASSAWSEARSNTFTRDLTPRQSGLGDWLGVVGEWLGGWSRFRLAASASLAAAVVVIAGLFFMNPGKLDTPRGTQMLQSDVARQAPNREQEIAGDNAMLEAIDSALYQPVPSPIEVYVMTGNAASAPRPTTSRQVRD